jgi:hypothetical protein
VPSKKFAEVFSVASVAVFEPDLLVPFVPLVRQFLKVRILDAHELLSLLCVFADPNFFTCAADIFVSLHTVVVFDSCRSELEQRVGLLRPFVE